MKRMIALTLFTLVLTLAACNEEASETYTIEVEANIPLEYTIEPSFEVEPGESTTVSIESYNDVYAFSHWRETSSQATLTARESYTFEASRNRTLVAVFEEAEDVDGFDAFAEQADIEEGQAYTTPMSVALYLHEYGELPPNYIPYAEFEETEWTEDQIRDQTEEPFKSLGYKSFSNRDETLDEGEEFEWWKTADIQFDGGRLRGIERLVFNNEGTIYFTDDHYDSYTQFVDGSHEPERTIERP